MNTENFDMDGSLENDEPHDRKKNRKKTNSRILLIIFFILLVLCGVGGYFYITGAITNTTKKNVADSSPTKVSSIETIDSNNASNTSTTTSISDANVSPVVNVGDDQTLALDISKVKTAKAQEGAVQFREHIVQANEDLNSIAKLYSLKVQTIISINEIKNISGVVEGIVLSIPDRNGRYYIVDSGDMLSTIANENCPNLGWKTLQEINGLTDTRLDIGDTLFIPDMSEIIVNPTISTSTNKFSKPSNGLILAKYGQFIEDNPYNDEITLNGILIKVDSTVVTSAKGVVVDILNKNGKKTVKLSHDGGYETVYGNLENTQLAIGNEVDVNSEVGTVSSDDKTLYFEIIQSGIPLDPESFF